MHDQKLGTLRSARQRNTRGITLIEMVVVIVVMAIALTAITQLLGNLTVSGAATYDETKAVELAQSLAGEIRSKRFDENSAVNGVPPCTSATCTPTPTNLGDNPYAWLDEGFPSPYNRLAFDDIDDFHNLEEGAGSGRDLVYIDGTTRAGYDNFKIQVFVAYAGDEAPFSGDEIDNKRVQIVVTQPNGEAVNFSFYVANY
jgi:MSHA pilin protein MshD